MHEIHEASKATTAALPTATYEENLKVVNETTGAFGSLHHALEHLTFMQKAASVIHAAAGDKVQDDAGEMGNKMARFAEERGSAGNGEQFEREMGKLVQAIAFTRGNFNPTEMLNFAQQAKASLIGYNEEFLTGVMPSIVSTMKGDRAGTAANAFNGVIDGKVNDKKQAEEWAKLGLLDKSQAIMKAGHAVGWRTGAIKDTAGAHANPLEWMENVVLPALKEKGGLDGKGIDINDKEQLKQAFATLYRNQNANMFASEIGQLQMRQRLHKDKALMEKSGTLDENYKRNLAQDPKVAGTALRAGVENVSSSATAPAMESAAKAITAAAASLQSLANLAQDYPNLAMAGGATAAGGALAGAGLLSYKIATGFGLGTSATALSTSAAALSAAAAELTGAAAAQSGKGTLGALGGAGATAGRLGALGAVGLGVGAAAGVAAIAAGVYAVDQSLPNNNRMNGNGRAARAPASAFMPESWGNGGLNVAKGAGAVASPFVTSRPKTWGETIFGQAPNRGGRDPTKMNLPLPGSWGATQAPPANALPVGMSPAVDKLKSLNNEVIAPKFDTSGVDAFGHKVDEVKAKAAEAGALNISIPVTLAGAGTAIQQLERIINLGAQANASIGSVNAGGGALRGRTFSDGATPGAGAH